MDELCEFKKDFHSKNLKINRWIFFLYREGKYLTFFMRNEKNVLFDLSIFNEKKIQLFSDFRIAVFLE